MFIEVFGLLKDESFHIAKCCAEDLKMKHGDKFSDPLIKPMLECEWKDYLDKKKIELKGEVWAFSDPVICFADERLLGNHKDLIRWANDEYSYEDFRPSNLYTAIAHEAYLDYFSERENTFVFMDISIDGKPEKRLLFELFSKDCPKTCENFKFLCTGEKGALPSGLVLHYANTPIHRIVPNGWIQGGDIVHGRGDDGASIFGEVFEDENFIVKHDRRGVLGMANKGRHSNSSQFYITLQPTPWMNHQYVAFGVLVEGTELLKTLEDLPTFNERPKVDCRIVSSGVFTRNDAV